MKKPRRAGRRWRQASGPDAPQARAAAGLARGRARTGAAPPGKRLSLGRGSKRPPRMPCAGQPSGPAPLRQAGAIGAPGKPKGRAAAGAVTRPGGHPSALARAGSKAASSAGRCLPAAPGPGFCGHPAGARQLQYCASRAFDSPRMRCRPARHSAKPPGPSGNAR